MLKSLAIYCNDIKKNIDLINKIKDFFSKTDFVIFADNIVNVPTTEIAILLTYYMRFYHGTVVFLDIDEYLTYKDTLVGKAVLFFNKNDAYDKKISKVMIKNVKIITLDDQDNIEMVEL